MTTGSAGIIRLKEVQIGRASGVLSRAFRDDPGLSNLVPETKRRQRLLHYLFRVALKHALEHGEVYTVSPAIEGVAIWLPSDVPELSFREAFRGGLGLFFRMKWRLLHGGLGILFMMNWGLLRKMREDEDFAKGLRRQLAPFDHWYLAVLGVAPEFQGRGYASRLLKPMLARLDREGIPAYLETDTEDYVSFYQHFGFRVIKETRLPGSGARMWAMLRKAKEGKKQSNIR